MNNLSYITLILWQTRNWRHRQRALLWCRDYGFRQLSSGVFIGETYAKERAQIRNKFKGLFTGKTEKFYLVTLCQSCFNGSMLDPDVMGALCRNTHYELIQMGKYGSK